MKKYFISFIFALSALVMLNGCIVSDKKLSEKVQQAIVDDEQTKGNTLEVTDFNLDQKEGKQTKGVLKGRLNGKDVTYDVTLTDEGSDFDIDWELRE